MGSAGVILFQQTKKTGGKDEVKDHKSQQATQESFPGLIYEGREDQEDKSHPRGSVEGGYGFGGEGESDQTANHQKSGQATQNDGRFHGRNMPKKRVLSNPAKNSFNTGRFPMNLSTP
jgi:hypothetical protein